MIPRLELRVRYHELSEKIGIELFSDLMIEAIEVYEHSLNPLNIPLREHVLLWMERNYEERVKREK